MTDLNFETNKTIDLFTEFPTLMQAEAWAKKYDDSSNENKQMTKETEVVKSQIERREREMKQYMKHLLSTSLKHCR